MAVVRVPKTGYFDKAKMGIPLDSSQSEPLYKQIERWFRRALKAGEFRPGDRLPPTRQLAQELGVSRITVERAYSSLLAEGLVEGRGSGGTVVARRLPEGASIGSLGTWQAQAVAGRNPQPRRPSKRAEALVPEEIDLSTGLGDPLLFDMPAFHRVLNTVRLRDGVAALDYGDPLGYRPLREIIRGILATQGLSVSTDSILVTAGSQQAITLVASSLLRPGDTVLVETPTYNGALDLFRVLGLNVVGVPIDQRGLPLGLVERALQTHRPQLIYTMPTYQNPSGISLDLGRRRGLLDLAARSDVPILEDDFVGDLRYEGRGHPTLKALDRTGHVIYVSTFSKMLLPGLRTGYLVLEGPVFDLLAEHKRVTDLASAGLIQRTLAEYVGVGRYQTHLKRSVRLYRRRRDLLASALAKWAPRLRWNLPSGGLFLWLEAPFLSANQDLANLALGVGVRLASGGAFFPDGTPGSSWARLNFAAATESQLEEAARRLGSLDDPKSS